MGLGWERAVVRARAVGEADPSDDESTLGIARCWQGIGEDADGVAKGGGEVRSPVGFGRDSVAQECGLGWGDGLGMGLKRARSLRNE